MSRVTQDREIVALHPIERLDRYGMEVHHQIRRDERDDYTRIGRSMERCTDVVAIQFDAGVWGGDDGESVLDFVDALAVPAIVTLHSLPTDPTPRQREIVVALADAVATTVVLSRTAADLLVQTYTIDPFRMEVIPHGVPDLPSSAPESSKAALGLAGRSVVLSFGLLGPDKDIEPMLQALPEIVAADPTTTYVILGATHPDVIRAEGQAYRERLTALAAKLKVADNVRIVGDFVGRNDLTRWIQAADVIVIPGGDPARTDSGALAYAMSAGRAIVAKHSPYADELLADRHGTLVDGTPASFAAAVGHLFAEPGIRSAMGDLAHERSRAMSWTRVGASYASLVARVAASEPQPQGVRV